MKCVVLVPTRDRPKLLQRALLSFFAAVSAVPIDIALVVIADDGSDAAATRDTLGTVQEAFPNANFACLFSESGTARPNGPGETRNQGLDFIVQNNVDHDSVLMFDDDICFSSCVYQGEIFHADAEALLSDIVSVTSRNKVIVGCRLIGRQDLSTLENLDILIRIQREKRLLASMQREDIEHVGPQGLSSAFLFVPAHASELPRFLPWYNEDYFWLTRMARGGWHLHQSVYALIHAPKDGLEMSAERFWFEQYGEALWAASTANEYHGVSNDEKIIAKNSLEERIRQIGDIEHIIAQDKTDEAWSNVTTSLARVRSEFEAILKDLGRGRATEFVDNLKNVERYLTGWKS